MWYYGFLQITREMKTKAQVPNVKKSLSLSVKLNDDLARLTEKLGINSHSYIVNEIAKCVARDLHIFNVQEESKNNLQNFTNALEGMLKENPED
mgnify:CR=1 FL=1